MLLDHVWSSGVGRAPAIAAEVVQVRGWRGDVIPVVASTHEDRITVHNWSPKSGNFEPRWFATAIDHLPFAGMRFLSPTHDQLGELGRAAWCDRLGLTTGSDPETGRQLVFLVYKRCLEAKRPPNLYIDVFELIEEERFRLKRVTESPVEFPFAPHDTFFSTGYYLWAGFHDPGPDNPDFPGPRLIVLTQTYAQEEGPAKLIYFSASAFDNPGALADKSAWTLSQIGDGHGGYDLDAKLVGDEIHCVFRDSAYPVSLSFAPGGGVDANGVLDVGRADYAPLVYARIRARDGAVVQVQSQLPGGEHPQLQSVVPLAYTADRMSEGAVALDQSSRPVEIRYEVDRSRKHLFLDSSGLWTTTYLMDFSERDYARTPLTRESGWCIQDPIVFIPRGTEQLLKVARPHSMLPVHATRFDWMNGHLEADLTHHDRDIQALVMTRIDAEPEAAPQAADLSHFVVLDINHETIPPFDTTPTPPANSENNQFFPFNLRRLNADNRDFRWSLRQAGNVYNSTGGDLAAEQAAGASSSLVFVHPADGGVRLLFDVDAHQLNPIANPPGRLDPEAIQGDGGGTWLEIEPGPGDVIPIPGAETGGPWLRYTQPRNDHFYLAGATRFSGLDDDLHAFYALALAGLVGTLSTDEREVVVEVGDLVRQPESRQAWDLLWGIWDQIDSDVTRLSSLVTDIGSMTLEFSKFAITWEPRHRVTVRFTDLFRTQFRFVGQDSGQGRIEGKFNIRVSLSQIGLPSWLGSLATASAEINLEYRRPYSPALLMSDRIRDGGRWDERLDRGSRHDAVAFTTKPVGSSRVTTTARTTFNWTAGGHALVWIVPALISLLIALRLDLVAAELTAAAAIPFVGYAIVVWMLENTVPRQMENSVNEEIADHDFKPTLDGTAMLTHAGEGIAEEIAYRVLSDSERERAGLNRFRQGVWRMVYVTDNQCRVLRGP